MKCIGNCINCEQDEASKPACCQLQTLRQIILLRQELRENKREASAFGNLNTIETTDKIEEI